MLDLPALPVFTTDEIQKLLSAISLPAPDTITFPNSPGQLHRIILLTWPEGTVSDILTKRKISVRQEDSSTSLILRIASQVVSHVKLENETATYIWLARNTSIPVPQIVHHDSSIDNELGHEYMLMTYAQGECGAKLYKNMTEAQMDFVLDQLGEHLILLSQHTFNHIGGLKTTESGELAPGPVVDETQWMEVDITKHWPPGTTFADLNPTSRNGYPSYTAFLTAYMICYLRAIQIHPALKSLSYLDDEALKMLNHFVSIINEPALKAKLNDIPYVLAHRDLHFGQLLINPETYQITAVLDWEFAGVVAFPLWKTCFLWSGDPDTPWSSVRVERKKLRDRWKARVRNVNGVEGEKMLKAQKWKCKEQRAAWDVVNYLRCVVEVVPRNVQLDDAKGWWKEITRALAILGIVRRNSIDEEQG